MKAQPLPLRHERGLTPTLEVVDWLLRKRPARLLQAAGRSDLGHALIDHPPLTDPLLVDTYLQLLHWAAASIRGQREVAWQAAAGRLGRHSTDPSQRRLWRHVQDATWRVATAAAAGHGVSLAVWVAGPYLGPVDPQAMLDRTTGTRDACDQDWKAVVDAAGDAVCAVVWSAIGQLTGPWALDPRDPTGAWTLICNTANAALAPALTQLDHDAFGAGIRWDRLAADLADQCRRPTG